MALITIFLTVVSLTTPTLEELSQRTEPWVREDVTITSVSEFHTSDFLREDEPVLLLHHAFLDDENETLRTVVCTDTRVIVLEEGVVVREIELIAMPVVLKCSPSGRFISIHRERDTLAGVRAFRVDTETGEQVYYDPFPGMNPQVDTWAVPNDDGTVFSVTGGRTWVFDADLNSTDGPVTGIGYTTPYAFSKNGNIMYIPANRSAYDRQGNLLWTLPEEYASSRVNSAAISDDGSLVGLATRDGVFLFNGATGVVVAEYFTSGNEGFGVGHITISPSGSRLLVRRLDNRVIVSSVCLETDEQYSFALGARVRAILESGIALLDSMVLDSHLNPYYVPGRHIYAISSSGRRLVQSSEWFPTHPNSAFAATGIQSVLPAGFQVIELQAGGN